jgi:glycosyltransferase involved in cell wall biosynthesis
MGKPVIATNVAGCRDVVEDGVTGLLCEPKSSQSLAGAMLSFAAMPENDRQAMGRRARDKAEREFSEDSIVDAYVDVIAQLAAAMSQPETRRAAV